jgi:glycine hydroxymethyltransferase
MFDRTPSTLAHVGRDRRSDRRRNRRQEGTSAHRLRELRVARGDAAPQPQTNAEELAALCGCEFVDVVEQLAIDRVKKLFGAGYANVRASSGSQALSGAVRPDPAGDTIMGMSLAGSHLTHGMALNMSGKWFKVVSWAGGRKRSTTTRWAAGP